jgi:2-(1,2-epoxy-1,2-dihydrophenyl)acetyl-CoA isomerase
VSAGAVPDVGCTLAAEGVLVITLGASGRMPLIDFETLDALIASLACAQDEAGVRVVVLRSGAPWFCGGGDLRLMRRCLAQSLHRLAQLVERFHESILAIRALRVPVVASVGGAAAGGGFSLALACDLLVAARSARFVCAYSALRTTSDGGLSYFLSQPLGRMKALDILATRTALSASELERLGFVARLVDDGDLDEATSQLADTLRSQPVQALSGWKRLLCGDEPSALRAHLDRERDEFLRCAGTPEFAARLSAA